MEESWLRKKEFQNVQEIRITFGKDPMWFQTNGRRTKEIAICMSCGWRRNLIKKSKRKKKKKMKTYNIRVRADYVGYYKIEAKSLDDAEAMAQQELFNEMNDGVDGVFDFEEFEDETFGQENDENFHQTYKKLKQWAEEQ